MFEQLHRHSYHASEASFILGVTTRGTATGEVRQAAPQFRLLFVAHPWVHLLSTGSFYRDGGQHKVGIGAMQTHSNTGEKIKDMGGKAGKKTGGWGKQD